MIASLLPAAGRTVVAVVVMFTRLGVRLGLGRMGLLLVLVAIFALEAGVAIIQRFLVSPQLVAAAQDWLVAAVAVGVRLTKVVAGLRCNQRLRPGDWGLPVRRERPGLRVRAVAQAEKATAKQVVRAVRLISAGRRFTRRAATAAQDPPVRQTRETVAILANTEEAASSLFVTFISNATLFKVWSS